MAGTRSRGTFCNPGANNALMACVGTISAFLKMKAVYIVLGQEFKVCDHVSNQQDATTFSFINLFNSALHVSGEKFAQPQEHFLTVYTVKKCS